MKSAFRYLLVTALTGAAFYLALFNHAPVGDSVHETKLRKVNSNPQERETNVKVRPAASETANSIIQRVTSEGGSPMELLEKVADGEERNAVIDIIVDSLGFDEKALAKWFERLTESNELERHLDQFADNLRRKVQSPRRELEIINGVLKAISKESFADPARKHLLREFVNRSLMMDRESAKSDFLSLSPHEQELAGENMVASLMRYSPKDAVEFFNRMEFVSTEAELSIGASLATSYLAVQPMAATEWVGHLDPGPLKSKMIVRVAAWWIVNGANESLASAESFASIQDRREYLTELEKVARVRNPALANDINKAIDSIK